MEGAYQEFALILAASAVLGFIGTRLRQPLLLTYILVGILAGPAVLGWVAAHDQIDLLAQMGITVLLFIVGLKLDLRSVRRIGPVALATGLGQLAFTIVVGFCIILSLGRDVVTAIYVAVALTFSSTIIIVKLLSDKKELDSLHGRIAVGFLIVQDIAVVIAMMVMSALRGADAAGNAWTVGLSLAGRIGAMAASLYLVMRFVLPRLMQHVARSQELLLIFAVAWGLTLAAMGEWVGFSKEAGAFLAGFSLASTGYREVIGSRLASLRDFLLLFFFVDLGSKLVISDIGTELPAALILSLFVLIGNPLIVMAIMGYMGYRSRTGFLAGLTVAQISEFSIVFVAMGISLGHIAPGSLTLTTLVGLITITLSTYMILYSEHLFERVKRLLSPFERTIPFREARVAPDDQETSLPAVVVFGLGRYGSRLLGQLKQLGIEVMGVDFDPEVVRALQKAGMHVHFGDCEDLNFLASLPLRQASWIVSTLPRPEAHQILVHGLKYAGYRGKIAVIAREEAQHGFPEDCRADKVFLTFEDSADYAARELNALFHAGDTPAPQ